MYLSNKYHTPLILSSLSLRLRLKLSDGIRVRCGVPWRLSGSESRDGDSPLRGITATLLSDELRGELSGPLVIRSEDVSHDPEEG